MLHIYQGDHGSRFYLASAIQGRAEAQGRAVYLAIVGIETSVRFLGRAIMGGLHRAAQAHARHRSRRQTIKALSGLDHRMLRDIGIDPHDIPELATEMVASETVRAVPDGGLRQQWPVAPPRLVLDCLGTKRAA